MALRSFLLTFLLGVSALAAPLANGDFEQGDLSGWQTFGNTAVALSEAVSNPGLFSALLSTDGSGGPTTESTFSNIETALGLAPGTVFSLGNYNATYGSAIYRTVTAVAGEAITFNSRFLSNETSSSFNDVSFFSVTGGGGLTHVQFLGDAGAAASISGPAFNTFDRSANPVSGSYTFTNSGTYTIGFGVANVADNLVRSCAFHNLT